VAALRNDSFLAGDTTTSFIERSGVPVSRPVSAEELRVASVAAALAERAGAISARRVLRSLPSGWRNTPMPPETRKYLHAGEEIEVRYRPNRDGTLDLDGRTVRLHSLDGGWVDFEESDSRHRVHTFAKGGDIWAQGPDGDVRLSVQPRFPEADRGAQVPGGLTAPMPGKVISVNVQSGDKVSEGDVLMIVEAMKMEHRVLAPHSGTVGEVRAHLGDQVNGGDLLVVIEEKG
jgi:propionyl-CoA carboxylase alpha chain